MMKFGLKTPLAIAIAIASTSAYTQDTGTESAHAGLEEVVVTAQKREQNLQDTPVAITAIDTQTLHDQKVKDISDLSASIPNVSIAPSPGGSTGATIAIRGASTINPAITWEPAVGIYVDGVFVAKNIGGLFDVAELERVEILRGPQGSLYGKNTTGGAISLITRKPAKERGGNVTVGAGNYGYTEYGASIDSGRIADFLSLNVSYNKRDRDGFYDNANSGLPGAGTVKIDEFKQLDSEAGRVAALFDVSDAVEITYAYDWSSRDNTVAFGQLEPGIVDANHVSGFQAAAVNRLDSGSLDGAGVEEVETSGHTLNVAWDINDNLLMKSITGYRGMKFYDENDYDGSPYVGFNTQRDIETKQTSQEFQLIGKAGSVNYVVGAFYFTEDSDAYNPFVIGGPGGPSNVDNFYGVESTSYALFGQADWAATDSLTFSLGARWTQEEKDAYVKHMGSVVLGATDYDTQANETWDNFSPMFTASYAVNDDITTYAKVSQGWKAGGFNAEATDKMEAETPYDEETLTSYELGFKSRWLDSRLQANIAVFYNDIKDKQISNYLGAYSIIENAGKANVQGFELETIYALTESLTAFFNYGYLDSSYDEYIVGSVDIASTAQFPYSPENKYSLGFEYVRDLGFSQLRTRIDYSFSDEQYFYAEEPKATLTSSEDYALLNARIALTDIAIAGDNTLEVGIWGKNLTDEEYRLNGIPGDSDGDRLLDAGINYYGDPRTIGADLTYRF